MTKSNHHPTSQSSPSKAVKQREYQRQYQQQRRKKFKLVTVSIPKENQAKLIEAAKEHQQSLAQFLLSSSLAYLKQSFLIPHPDNLSQLQQLLSLWHTDFQRLLNRMDTDEPTYIIRILQQRVATIEEKLTTIYTQPLPVPKPAYDH